MKKLLVVALALALLLGCASLAAERLHQAYRNGQISEVEYKARLSILQNQMQNQAAFSQSLMNYRPPTPHLIVPSLPQQPRSGHGTIMTPKGQLYYYDWSEY